MKRRIKLPLQALGIAALSKLPEVSSSPASIYASIKEGESYPLKLPGIDHIIIPGPMIRQGDQAAADEFYAPSRLKGSYGFYRINGSQKIQVIAYHSFYTETRKKPGRSLCR